MNLLLRLRRSGKVISILLPLAKSVRNDDETGCRCTLPPCLHRGTFVPFASFVGLKEIQNVQLHRSVLGKLQPFSLSSKKHATSYLCIIRAWQSALACIFASQGCLPCPDKSPPWSVGVSRVELAMRTVQIAAPILKCIKKFWEFQYNVWPIAQAARWVLHPKWYHMT